MPIGPSHAIGLSLVLVAALVESAAHVTLKRGVAPGSEWTQMFRSTRARWFAGAAISLFIVEGFLWTLALHRLDLSIAQPAGSLTFVLVAIASRVVLKEHISPRRWAGIALILAGVAAMGAS